MLDYETHRKLQEFNRDLNALYLESKPFWDDDFSWNGFRWLLADAKDDNVIAYKRYDRKGNSIAAIFNFSGAARIRYRVPTVLKNEPESYSFSKKDLNLAWRIIFSSDNIEYGGDDLFKDELYIEENGDISVNLAPLSAIYLKSEPYAGENTIVIDK